MTVRQNRIFIRRALPTGIAHVVSFVRSAIEAGTSKPLLPGTGPYLASLRVAVDAYEQALVAAQLRTKGLVTARNEKLRDVREAWDAYVDFVERLANADLATAREVVAEAQLEERGRSLPNKAPFDVEPGHTSGTVRATARSAGDRASYAWAFSLDGGKTWSIAARTTQANYTFTDQPAGRYVIFRLQITLPAGELDWTEPLTVLVK